MTLTEHFHIDGIVQGVGFRPFVYRLATERGLSGWVRNNSRGVDIEVSGDPSQLESFARALREQAPPLAQITAITRRSIPFDSFGGTFVIVHSEDEGGFTLVSPDVATCPDCLRELFDPTDRRYRYPFINCTNCGPRFSIIRALPYDRPNTTMSVFPMCADCRAEYEDPLNRRFHAQPNACPTCGPHVWLELPSPQPLSLRERGEGVRESEGEKADPLTDAARALLSGSILAIKGLGGFHIACDARNAAAVRVLRERKPRPRKPLAVMMRDMDMVRAFCEVSPEEARLLTSPAAPIVLLEPRPDAPIAPEVAPGQRALGVMLPYTPLHHILLREVNCPLVMTSGNRQNEPIARTNAEARAALTPIVDGFLWHNREIHNRNDDSVWMVAADGPVPVRRSRGYAPRPVALPWEASRPVLAAGSQMKNTFCLLTGNQAFLSQHIGEMDYLQTWEFFTESVRRYRDLFGIRPQALAHDLHPDFTLAALDALHTLAAEARPVPVQHHHAHIAACMAENGVNTPVIGVALDGTGYGPDGTIWGGEILIADFSDYERAARLEVFPLPGGERAIREPLRTAFGLLLASFESLPPRLDFAARLGPQVRRAIRQQIERRLNTPLTSSCGRLFDAVSALLGICERVTYEGQAAIEMETLAAQVPEAAPYPLGLERVDGLWQMPSRALFRSVAEDMLRGTDVPLIAARFHQSVIASVRRAVLEISRARGLKAVALSGGCFQNRILLDGLTRALRADGLTVYTHHQVPPNDGGISLGQAVIAADLAPTPHPVSPPRVDGDR